MGDALNRVQAAEKSKAEAIWNYLAEFGTYVETVCDKDDCEECDCNECDNQGKAEFPDSWGSVLSAFINRFN